MKKKLKFFTDKSFLPEGAEHAEMLYPFWGLIWKNRFGNLINVLIVTLKLERSCLK